MENKRKVGGVVIMHHNHNNYGTSLQGFASVKIIEKLGHELRIIRYTKKRTLKEILTTTPGLIRSGALHELKVRFLKKTDVISDKDYAKNLAIRTQAVNQFKAKYFDSISDYYVGYEDLCKGSVNYDIIFVGSDQVWGPLSLYSRFYNLLFVDKSVPQFSYASSFGISNVLPWQKEGVKEYLDKMDAVGVREIRGKEIVDSLSENKAKVVADPTFLLTKQDWEEYMVNSKAQINEPYIFTYVLGPREDIREEIIELGRKTGLKVVVFRHVDWYEPKDRNFGDVALYDVDPLDFIKLLSNAEYVCTDSFHGTVFSIIFNKKFLTFYRQKPTSAKSTHSRIDSLLKLFDLEDRLFKTDALKQIEKNINYERVNQILSDFREDSLAFLKECLKINKKK